MNFEQEFTVDQLLQLLDIFHIVRGFIEPGKLLIQHQFDVYDPQGLSMLV